MRWLIYACALVACSGEATTSRATPTAEAPAVEQAPESPMAPIAPGSARPVAEPDPASHPDAVPPPKRSAVGGACAVTDPWRLASGHADRVSIAVGPEGGLLGWTSGADLSVQRLTVDGRPDGPVRVEPLPGPSRLLAMERLAVDRVVRVLTRRTTDAYGSHRHHLTLSLLDRDGAPVGEALRTELANPRVVQVVEDRLVIGGDVGLEGCCGLEHRVYQLIDGALTEVATCHGTHVCSRPGCAPPFRAVRAFAQGERDAIVVGLAQDHLGHQLAVACDSDRRGRDYYELRYFGDSVRSIVATESSVALLFRGQGRFRVQRDNDWEHTEVVTPDALPEDFAELITPALRALPSAALELRRYDAVRRAVGPPIEIGRFAERPRRLLDPPADLAWTGRAFVVAWAGERDGAPAVVARRVTCEGAPAASDEE